MEEEEEEEEEESDIGQYDYQERGRRVGGGEIMFAT